MKTEQLKGFTLMEVVTAIVVIAILMSLLMPALSQVKKIALETRQKAQNASIGIGIEVYKNDFGEYPPSHGSNPANCSSRQAYCGAQTLSEAMFGLDLLGFHSESVYNPDDSNDPVGFYMNDPNLEHRVGPYLDRTNIGVFTPYQIFERNTCSEGLEPSRYLICDVFTTVNRTVGRKIYKVGTPILYFRANESALNTQLIPSAAANGDNIYDYTDNYYLMALKRSCILSAIILKNNPKKNLPYRQSILYAPHLSNITTFTANFPTQMRSVILSTAMA